MKKRKKKKEKKKSPGKGRGIKVAHDLPQLSIMGEQ
jgi:hypothetical protein